jgi:hypothetical protein
MPPVEPGRSRPRSGADDPGLAIRLEPTAVLGRDNPLGFHS